MILVDTSVWVDHLRRGDPRLAALLDNGEVLMHPFVVGEIACGSLADRSTVLGALLDLPQSVVATDVEAMHLVGRHRLWGKGLGWVDVHLLTSARLTPGALLWTRDKRLQTAASDLGCAFDPGRAY